eukprot:g7475.t1
MKRTRCTDAGVDVITTQFTKKMRMPRSSTPPSGARWRSPKRCKVQQESGEIDIIFRGLDLNSLPIPDARWSCKGKRRLRVHGAPGESAGGEGSERRRDGPECEGGAAGSSTELVVRLPPAWPGGPRRLRRFRVTARSVADLLATLRCHNALPAPAPAYEPGAAGVLPPECLQLARRQPAFLPALLRRAFAGICSSSVRVFVASPDGRVFAVRMPAAPPAPPAPRGTEGGVAVVASSNMSEGAGAFHFEEVTDAGALMDMCTEADAHTDTDTGIGAHGDDASSLHSGQPWQRLSTLPATVPVPITAVTAGDPVIAIENCHDATMQE